MPITPTLNLFVNYDDPEPYYWVDVILPEGGTHETVSHETVPNTANAIHQFLIDVNVKTPNSGNETIQVILGHIELHPTNGEVHVNLWNPSAGPEGNGVVIAEDSQEASRPVPE